MDSKTCSPRPCIRSPSHTSSSQSDHLDYSSISPSSTPDSSRRAVKPRSRSAERGQFRRSQTSPQRYSKPKPREDESRQRKSNKRTKRPSPARKEEKKGRNRSPEVIRAQFKGSLEINGTITLFCTNLPKVWQEISLKRTEKDAFSYFDKYVKVLKTQLHSSTKRNDPRCMYVTVRDQEDALYVIKELDGKKAKPTVRKEEKPDEQMVIRIVPKGQDFRLIVKKVPKSSTLEEVRGIFEFYGILKGVQELKSKDQRCTNKITIEFAITYSRPEMAHQVKSVLVKKPLSIKEGEQPLEVVFESEKAEERIKKLDPKYHLTYPLNHSFQEKYLKVEYEQQQSIYYAFKDEKGKRFYFNPALGLTQYNRPSHHEFIVIGEEEGR